ncbi:hypothetical protein CYLTODRAFT_419780 [Cylindrobasidium torrendii FP15055 ss-10]|uniref:Uncharacterized protein n=1 Tax=Cylindrobasidium torrendii FP15055 ss-10 TaxID=1314674 RepID=A0A0D7BJK8_9AGAR|nr:hypothetical protein CYLTODRAFT_419780 [Cylindrobasidium torrendii FP15055 ss-10]
MPLLEDIDAFHQLVQDLKQCIGDYRKHHVGPADTLLNVHLNGVRKVIQEMDTRFTGDNGQGNSDIDLFERADPQLGGNSTPSSPSNTSTHAPMLPDSLTVKNPQLEDSGRAQPDVEETESSFPEHEASFSIDPGAIASTTSAYDVLVTPIRLTDITVTHRGSMNTRYARRVEVSLKTEEQLHQVIYVPSFLALVEDFLKQKGDDACLQAIILSDSQKELLASGALVASQLPIVSSEGDLEFLWRVGVFHIVAIIICLLHNARAEDTPRFWAQRGTASSRRTLHAYPDIQLRDREAKNPPLPCEVKPRAVVSDVFIPEFFDMETRSMELLEVELSARRGNGACYPFQWPQDVDTQIASCDQPVIQIWTQLFETGSTLGQLCGEGITVFASKLPTRPKTLVLSAACSFDLKSPSQALLSTYRVSRIAHTAAWASEFGTFLEQAIYGSKGQRQPLASTVLPGKPRFRAPAARAGLDIRRAYKLPVRENPPRRRHPVNFYKDVSGSSVDVSNEGPSYVP